MSENCGRFLLSLLQNSIQLRNRCCKAEDRSLSFVPVKKSRNNTSQKSKTTPSDQEQRSCVGLAIFQSVVITLGTESQTALSHARPRRMTSRKPASLCVSAISGQRCYLKTKVIHTYTCTQPDCKAGSL